MDTDEEQARLRLWQDASLSADVDLDALEQRHSDDDDVRTLVDLTRSVRHLAVVLAHGRTEQKRARRRPVVRRA